MPERSPKPRLLKLQWKEKSPSALRIGFADVKHRVETRDLHRCAIGIAAGRPARGIAKGAGKQVRGAAVIGIAAFAARRVEVGVGCRRLAFGFGGRKGAVHPARVSTRSILAPRRTRYGTPRSPSRLRHPLNHSAYLVRVTLATQWAAAFASCIPKTTFAAVG
jgi:hypothetical protein